MTLAQRLWNDERGVSATEYGIIAALVAIGLVTALFTFREDLKNMFGRASSAVRAGP